MQEVIKTSLTAACLDALDGEIEIRITANGDELTFWAGNDRISIEPRTGEKSRVTVERMPLSEDDIFRYWLWDEGFSNQPDGGLSVSVACDVAGVITVSPHSGSGNYHPKALGIVKDPQGFAIQFETMLKTLGVPVINYEFEGLVGNWAKQFFGESYVGQKEVLAR